MNLKDVSEVLNAISKSEVIKTYEEKVAKLRRFLLDHDIFDAIILIKIIEGHGSYNIKEFLLFDGSDMSYTWANDWWEGDDFEFIGAISVDDVPEGIFYSIKVGDD